MLENLTWPRGFKSVVRVLPFQSGSGWQSYRAGSGQRVTLIRRVRIGLVYSDVQDLLPGIADLNLEGTRVVRALSELFDS